MHLFYGHLYCKPPGPSASAQRTCSSSTQLRHGLFRSFGQPANKLNPILARAVTIPPKPSSRPFCRLGRVSQWGTARADESAAQAQAEAARGQAYIACHTLAMHARRTITGRVLHVEGVGPCSARFAVLSELPSCAGRVTGLGGVVARRPMFAYAYGHCSRVGDRSGPTVQAVPRGTACAPLDWVGQLRP